MRVPCSSSPEPSGALNVIESGRYDQAPVEGGKAGSLYLGTAVMPYRTSEGRLLNSLAINQEHGKVAEYTVSLP